MAKFQPIEDSGNTNAEGNSTEDNKPLGAKPEPKPSNPAPAKTENTGSDDAVARLTNVLADVLSRIPSNQNAPANTPTGSDPLLLAQQFKTQFRKENHLSESERTVFICIGGKFQDWGYFDRNGEIVTPPFRNPNGSIKPITFDNPESRPTNSGQRGAGGPELSFLSSYVPEYRDEVEYIRNHILFGIRFFERSNSAALNDISIMENIYNCYTKVKGMNDQLVLDNANVYGIEVGGNIEEVRRSLITAMAKSNPGIIGNEAAANILNTLFHKDGIAVGGSSMSTGAEGFTKGFNPALNTPGTHVLGRKPVQ